MKLCCVRLCGVRLCCVRLCCVRLESVATIGGDHWMEMVGTRMVMMNQMAMHEQNGDG